MNPTISSISCLPIARPRRRGRWTAGLAALAVVCILAPATQAQAPAVAFSVDVGGQARSATVSLISRNDVAYVALNSVVEQLGGGWTTAPGRVQVDFDGKSAWLALGGTGVNASLGDFSLRQPVLQEDVHILMSLSDVAPFFKGAFAVEMRQNLAPRRTAPSADDTIVPEPAPISAQELEQPQLLEPMTLTDSPAQPATVAAPSVRRVVIDPGHGGNDPGCEGRTLKEKDLTLAVARQLMRALQSAGITQVLLTRMGDVNLPLAARINFVNNHQPDLFISLHVGSSLSPGATGFQVFCPPERARSRAPAPQSGLSWVGGRDHAAQSAQVAMAIAKGLEQTTQARNRGVYRADCRIFKGVEVPALLIELGCITNESEEALLADEAYQSRLAAGIAAGIAGFAAAGSGAEVAP